MTITIFQSRSERQLTNEPSRPFSPDSPLSPLSPRGPTKPFKIYYETHDRMYNIVMCFCIIKLCVNLTRSPLGPGGPAAPGSPLCPASPGGPLAPGVPGSPESADAPCSTHTHTNISELHSI